MGISQKLFAKAMEIEALAGEVYKLLAASFAAGSSEQQLFSKLAAEERQHELRIQTLASLARRDRALDGAALPAEAALDALIRDARALKTLAASRGDRLTAENARQLSYNLEVKLADIHAEVVLDSTEGEVRSLFEKLAADDRAHSALLRSIREAESPEVEP